MAERHAVWSSFFVNLEEGRLRSLWRILLQVGIMLVIVALPIVVVTETATRLFKSGRIFLPPEIFDKGMDILAGLLLTGLVLLSLFIAARKLDHRRFAEFGFGLNAKWWMQWFEGFFLGFFLMAIIFTIEFFAGWVKVISYFHVSVTALPVWLSFTYPFIKALCVGVYEEAISRGYHLTNIKEGLLGLWGFTERQAFICAIGMSSAIFALLHLKTPNASVISTVCIIANGALLGTAFWVSGQLGIPIGFHMGWNLSQGLLFGFPVSGDLEIANVLQIQQRGPVWLTGGNFGPEGGLLNLVVSIAGIILLLKMRRLWRPT